MPTWLLISTFLILAAAAFFDLRRNEKEADRTGSGWTLDSLLDESSRYSLTPAELARYVRDADQRRGLGYVECLADVGAQGATDEHLSERLAVALGRRPGRGSPLLN